MRDFFSPVEVGKERPFLWPQPTCERQTRAKCPLVSFPEGGHNAQASKSYGLHHLAS